MLKLYTAHFASNAKRGFATAYTQLGKIVYTTGNPHWAQQESTPAPLPWHKSANLPEYGPEKLAIRFVDIV